MHKVTIIKLPELYINAGTMTTVAHRGHTWNLGSLVAVCLYSVLLKSYSVTTYFCRSNFFLTNQGITYFCIAPV